MDSNKVAYNSRFVLLHRLEANSAFSPDRFVLNLLLLYAQHGSSAADVRYTNRPFESKKVHETSHNRLNGP